MVTVTETFAELSKKVTDLFISYSCIVDGLDGNCASVEAGNTCITRWFTWAADVGMCAISVFLMLMVQVC